MGNADDIAPTIGDRKGRRLFAIGAKVSRRGRGALSGLAIVNLMALQNRLARAWIAGGATPAIARSILISPRREAAYGFESNCWMGASGAKRGSAMYG